MRFSCLWLVALLCPAVPAQPIVHADFLVSNETPAAFSGVVWIPAPPGAGDRQSFIATTTHSPDLARDLEQRRAFELPSQAVGGRIAVFLSLAAGERKIVTVHHGPAERMLRLKTAYPVACDARLTGGAGEATWESSRVAYRLRGGNVGALGKARAASVFTTPAPTVAALGRLALVGAGAQVIAVGPVAARVRAGEALLTIGRNDRWTWVDAPGAGARTAELELPVRAGERRFQGQGWIASLAGNPPVGLALYTPPECLEGTRGEALALRPDAGGRIRYAFAAYWAGEHQENVFGQGQGDEPLPRVPGMDRNEATGRILLRPPRMDSPADFEARLRGDLVHLTAPSKVAALSRAPSTYTAAFPPEVPVQPRAKGYREALGLALERVLQLSREGQNRFWFSSNAKGEPTFTEPNRNWGDGYWVSLLWDGFRFTGDERFRAAALAANRLMLGGETRELHATGLNYWNGSARSYQETGDPQWRASGIRCADMMARIADPVTGFIPEYGPAIRKRPADPYDQNNYVKIDALVGLPILWWAYEQTKDKRYLDVADRHTAATMRTLIEPDGSALQMLWHDPASGRILGVGTHQGYGGGSRWARGLAWVIDGFPDAYRVTRKESYRRQFERSAKWLEQHLPEDLVSWYDFDDQAVFWRYRDSSASAICAYGLLRMSELEPDRVLGARYRELGVRMVNALIDRCLVPVAPSDARPEGMLAHATYTKPQEGEYIWGNYSLVRSLMWLDGKGMKR